MNVLRAHFQPNTGAFAGELWATEWEGHTEPVTVIPDSALPGLRMEMMRVLGGDPDSYAKVEEMLVVMGVKEREFSRDQLSIFNSKDSPFVDIGEEFRQAMQHIADKPMETAA
jgi:hypothetical protein